MAAQKNNIDSTEWSIDRRTILRGAAGASAAGLLGVPAFSGAVLAGGEEELAISCELDVMCAVDASGSLTPDDAVALQEGVNAFIGALPTDGSVKVGALEFAAGEVRKLQGLMSPSDLTVSVEDDPEGDTPMPGALDIADQVLYQDSGQRNDAGKLIVLFTDGGPNYETKWSGDDINYSAGGYEAPRDDTTDWSAVGGNDVYDNDDGGIANVSKGEMDETARVAASIRDGSIGGGATLIASIYVDVVGDDQNAMTQDAIDEYGDLPSYLEDAIASDSLAIEGEIENIETLAEDLVETLEANCCDECPEDFHYKYEWVEDEEAEGECHGEFVIYDDDDNVVESVEGLELISVTCDEDGEPQEACFDTSYCELDYEVKAGQETNSVTVTEGEFCVEGIHDEDKGSNGVTYAISNIVFTCPE